LCKKLRRHHVRTFFAAQPSCTVAMEACDSAHHRARGIGRPGHRVRQILSVYVEPFIKRQKNDAANRQPFP
jgi:transposase